MGPVATNTPRPALFTNVFTSCLPLLLQNSALNLEKPWMRPGVLCYSAWIRGCESSECAWAESFEQTGQSHGDSGCVLVTRGTDRNPPKPDSVCCQGWTAREHHTVWGCQGGWCLSLSFVFLEHALPEYLGARPDRQHKEVYFREADIKKCFKWPNCRTRHSGNTAGALVSL